MSSRSIPKEICSEILLRLPVKSACVCKCVCKSWFSIISNPSFVKSHLDLTIQANKSNLILNRFGKSKHLSIKNLYVIHSISHDSLLSTDAEFLECAVEMDYPFRSSLPLCYSVKLLGCCHGLVCLSLCFVLDSYKGLLCLWNPTTKEYKRLPKSPSADVRDSPVDDFSMTGLCYDSKNEDYKLVTGFLETGFDTVVEIYSLGLNSWSSITNVPYKFLDFREVGLLVNGGLHWLVEVEDSYQIVVCLDISDQIFKEIQLPSKNYTKMSLGMLDGCLCAHFHVTNAQSEVWVMQDYGVDESWTKRYIINHERINEKMSILMWSFKSGEMLFWLTQSHSLAIYDPKDESVREPSIPSLVPFQLEGCHYESLVSLRSGTYVGGEEEDEDRM